MKVLSLDVGETTGYCLMEGVAKAWDVLDYGTFTAVSAVSKTLPLLKARPDLIVIERTAMGEFGDRTQESLDQQRFLHSLFGLLPEVKIMTIRPVDWKSGPWKNASATLLGKVSKHEKDAYRIALYAIERILPNVFD